MLKCWNSASIFGSGLQERLAIKRRNKSSEGSLKKSKAGENKKFTFVSLPTEEAHHSTHPTNLIKKPNVKG